MKHATPSIEAMLEHREWIQRLAQRLVADPNDAQDVVQETWLAALRNPPPVNGRSPRGWLVRVAQNAARQLGRARATRHRHEWAASVQGSAPSSEELIDRISVERSLVEDVVALPEPYRHTMLLRYLEELPPKAIADRTGTPIDTVKTRLKRGVVMLRERLDRRHGGDASTWLVALTPIAAKGSAANAGGAGALLVGVKSTLAWAAALLLTAGFLGWRAFHPAPNLSPIPLRPSQTAMASAGATMPPPDLEASPTGRTNVEVASDAARSNVRVVSAADGSPLPGADLWYVDAAVVSERARAKLGLELYDPEPDMRELGRHLVCDERGETQLPASDVPLRVIARSGELYGGALASDDNPLEVRCSKDLTVAVQVVDTGGKPLPGITVGLMERSDDRGTTWVRWRQPTRGADGIAHFRHIGTSVGTSPRSGSALSAILAFPNAEGVAMPVDLGALAEPVRLVAPETGRLVVELENGDGTPYSMEGWIEISRLAEKPDRSLAAERGVRHTRRLSGVSRVVLPHVGLGLELFVALPRDGIRKRVERVVPGPTRPGEECRVVLKVGPVTAHFSGRLTGPPDMELDFESVSIDAEYKDGESWKNASAGGPVSSEHVLLEGGRFLLPLSDRIPEGAPSRLSFRAASQDGVQLSGSCEALAPEDGAGWDCGAVALAPAPTIAAGFLTDQAGRPLPRVRLELGNKLRRDEPRDFVWQVRELSAAFTDDAGRFELRGELPVDDYALLARATGYTDRGWVPFQLGDRDVHVVLDAESSVSGLVLVDDGFPIERLTVVATYPEAERPPNGSPSAFQHTAAVQPGGGFELTGLRPGAPDLVLRTGYYSDPLMTISRVELGAGETASEERVSRIDLRGKVFETSLEIRDPGGAPVQRGTVTIVASEDVPASRLARPTFAIEDGRVSLITSFRPIDIEVASPGMVSASIRGIEDDAHVTLEKGLRVQLTVPEDIRLPPEPYVLRVGLLASDREKGVASYEVCLRDGHDLVFGRQELEWSHGKLDRDRLLELGVPFAGLYEVQWRILENHEPFKRGRIRIVRPARDSYRLMITPGATSFEIAPERDEYAKTLQSLR